MFIHLQQIEEARKCLARYGLVRRSYEQPYVQTVYLSDDQQTHSIGISLRARRYLASGHDGLRLSDLSGQLFDFEIKQESQDGDMTKVKSPRQKLLLRQTSEVAEEFTGEKVRPYFVVEYLREHFVRGDSLRVTLDTGTRFFFLAPSHDETIPLGASGESNGIRIEFKYDPITETDLVSRIIDELLSLGAIPVISKRMQAFNLLRVWRDRNFGVGKKNIVKETPGLEIEAKFSITGNLNRLFSGMIGQDFSPFQLDPSYPFVASSSSVNHYWGKTMGAGTEEGAKVLCRGSIMNFVVKDGGSNVDPLYGIVRRGEKKHPRFEYEGGGIDKLAQDRGLDKDLTYAGYLFRNRKAVWLRGPEERLYHLSVDRCRTDIPDQQLCQIEVECTGRVGTKNNRSQADNEKTIIGELQFLGDRVLSFLKT